MHHSVGSPISSVLFQYNLGCNGLFSTNVSILMVSGITFYVFGIIFFFFQIIFIFLCEFLVSIFDLNKLI